MLQRRQAETGLSSTRPEVRRFMNLAVIDRISVRLVIVPLVLLLVIYCAIGFGVYFLWAPTILSDVHSAQLESLMSGNRNAVNLWFDYRKRVVEEMTRQAALTDSLGALTAAVGAIEALDAAAPGAKREKERLEKRITDVRQRFAAEVSGQGQFRNITLVSTKGMVLASTLQELNGQDWSSSELFQRVSPERGVSAISGRVASAAQGHDFYFVVPLRTEGKDIAAYLFCRPDPAELAANLRPEGGMYATVRLSIVDTAGGVVAAQDMSEAGRVRYNVPRGGLEGADYRDGLFYRITPLKLPGLGLIATLQGSEAAKPLQPLATVYFGFAGLLLVFILLQYYWLAPRLIDRPTARLIKAARAVSAGDLRIVNLRKGFSGEFKLLADAFSQMVAGLGRQWSPSGRSARIAEGTRFRTSIAAFLTAEMKERLDVTLQQSDSLRAIPDTVLRQREAGQVIAGIRVLAQMMSDIHELFRFKDGLIMTVPEPFDLCAFLQGVEKTGRDLIGGMEMDLIVDCSATLSITPVVTDRRCLRRMVLNLLRNQIVHTDTGTITLLASRELRGTASVVEISISGSGAVREISDIFDHDAERGFVPGYPELSLAMEYAELIGATIGVSLSAGGGMHTLVSLPAEPEPLPEPEAVVEEPTQPEAAAESRDT
jgi:signal transduction histidine kinase